MRREDMFRDMPMGKLIAKTSVPLMFSMLVQALYNFVDGLFVAQLGLGPLTAVGIAFPVQLLVVAMVNGTCVGINAAVSQRFGRGDYEDAGRAAGGGVFLIIVETALMLLFGLTGCRTFMEFSSNDPEIIKAGAEYLSICMTFGFGQMFTILCQRLLVVMGRSAIGMTAHLVGAVTNLILDPIFIFGYLGLPAMGVKGAAIATVVGQILSLAFVASYMKLKPSNLKIKLKHIRPSRVLLEIGKPGVPAALTLAVGSIMSFGMNQILKDEAMSLAVYSAYYRLWSFAILPLNGLIQGVIPIAGYNYGARLKERLNSAMRLSVVAGAALMAAAFLTVQIFAPQIISWFDNGTNGTLFCEMGARTLRIVSWIFVPFAIAQILTSLYQGLGAGMPSLVYSLLHQCVLLLPAAWLLLRYSGVDGVWYAFWFAEGISLAIAMLHCRRYRKKLIVPLEREPLPSNA